MIFRIFTIIVVGVCAWIACVLAGAAYRYIAHGPIETGVVVGKSYTPTWIQHIPVGDSQTMIIHPESWSLIVEGKRTKTGLLDTASFGVSRERYDSTKVGDKWP